MISRYLIVATFALCANFVLGNQANPPTSRAGDPPTSLNCTSCHSGTANSDDGNFTIIGLPSFYTPNRTYELNLLLDKNATGYGFQAIAKSGNDNAGSLTAVTSGMTIDGGYAEHNTPSSTGQWTFKWTAPASDVGMVTFYASGLVADSNGNNGGDSVYTLTVDMNSSSSRNIPQVQDLVWSQPTGGAIYSSPTIGSDGTVYVGSGDDNLYAFYPDGGVKWTYQAGEWVDSTPAIADDGTIYVGSWDNKLHAINPDGTGKWTFATDSLVLAGPAVGPDGTIYFGSRDNFFYALESNGSKKWEYFAEQPISSSAALGQDGTIYFGDDNGTFHAVNPDGTSKWTYLVDTIAESNSSIESSPALDLYGYIYFGSANGYCYSLEDNGTNGVLRWKYATADRVDSSPVIGLSNEVLFMSRDGYLRSIDIDFGVTNWEKPIGDVFYSSPVVDENGTVYVVGYLGGGENHIFAIDANGSMDWNSSMTNHSVVIGDVVDSSLAIDSNGTLYFGSFDKKLYAVKAGWNLADSDWPKFRRDNLGTGRWPSYQIDANASPAGSGTIAGAGVHNQGATATLTATATTGYTFSHWSGDSNETNGTISLAATQHRSVTAHFTLNSYTLTASGGAGGIVSGSGAFTYGTVTPITATPGAGHSFTGWTGDGIADLNASNTTVLITQDRNVSAIFAIDQYTLTASGGVGGSVSGTGTFDWNSSTAITATPNTGYSFTGWIGTGITSPSAQDTTVLMTQDRNVSATFLINSYTLTTSPGSGGNVSSSGSHEHGTQVTITATPQTGYTFAGWVGSGITDANASTTTINMTQDRNASAIFAINQYALGVHSGTGGSTSGAGTYDWNSSISITATPSIGYEFSAWTGSGITNSNEAITTVQMTQDRNVTATFLINSYSLTTMSESGGSVSISGFHNHGIQASITATPQTGYSFTGWVGEGIADLNASATTVEMIQDRNVTATFAIDRHILIVSTESGGTITGSGTFDWNSSAPIAANVDTGYEFTGWTGSGVDDTMSLTTTIAMTQDRNVTATFAIKSYELATSSSAGGSVSQSGNYDHGTQATIIAVPQTGFYFTGWLGEGINDLNASTTTVSMTQDRNISANFDAIAHDLVVSAASGGSATGSGRFNYSTNAAITASPDEGHYFTNWSGEGLGDANSPSTTVSMTQDRNVTANFASTPIDKKILQTYADPVGSGSTSGSGPYDQDVLVNISTTSAPGYHFLGWTAVGGTLASPLSMTSASITMDQGSDANATAHFDALINTIAFGSSTGGSVSGDGNYSHGQLVPIQANPDIGYSFTGWEVNGTMVYQVAVAARQYSPSSTKAFFLNGKESPPLNLVRGNVYHFALDGSTTVDHPFYFSEDSGGGGNTNLGKFTTGVTGSESSSGIVAITVDSETPGTLFYYCGNHSGMGNLINIVDSAGLISDTNASATTTESNGSYVLQASFSLNEHFLTVNAGTGGSVSAGGTFPFGSTTNITATPNPGYIFSHWSGSGSSQPNSPTTTVSMTEDRTLTASFELGSYSLGVVVGANGGGSVIGGGNYEFGETINIFATPLEGYRFVEWTGDGLADPNAFGTTVTITASQTITATFASSNHDLLLRENIDGAGTLTGSGNYPYGSDVNVTATASSGYVFKNWNGVGIADENATATTISLTSDLNVTAYFEILTFPLNLSAEPSLGGTVVGNGSYNLGSNVNIIALPSAGYQFIRWIGGNPVDASASATTITVDGSADLKAEFERLQYIVGISVSPVGAATVSGGGSYQYGDVATLVSTPIQGYEFSHWSGANVADTNSSGQSITVSEDISLVANFERHADAGTLSYALDATDVGGGWQESSWFGYFHQTTPEWAYHFDFGWIYTKPENDSSMWFWTQRFGWQWTNKDAYPNAWSQDNYEWNYFSRISDGTFGYYDYSTSSWQKIATTYEITVVAYPSNAGSIIGGGVYEEGTTTNIQATPHPGYVFKRWFGDATGNSPSINITTSGNLIIYAYFEEGNP